MLKCERSLIARSAYLNQLIAFQDKDFVKIVTGVRRCGKSSLLKLMQNHLLNSGVEQDQIIAIISNSQSNTLYNLI